MTALSHCPMVISAVRVPLRDVVPVFRALMRGSSQSNSRRLPSRRFRGIKEPPLRAAPHLFHGRL